MKKALKITGITLGALLGVVIITVVIALCTITSPKRLTNLVKHYVPEFVDFDVELERANLTLFKTFPNIGLEIDHVAILSPMNGAPSDTLANIDQLIVSANAKKFLNDNEIVVQRCILNDAFVNIFTNEEGQSNLDIFGTSSDDTTSAPFNYSLDLQQIQVNNTTVLYNDLSSNLKANLHGLELDVKGSMKDDDIRADLSLSADDLQLAMSENGGNINDIRIDFNGSIEDYSTINGILLLNAPKVDLNLGYPLFNDDKLNLSLPLNFDLSKMEGSLKEAKIGLNDYLIQLAGNVAMPDNGDIDLDMRFSTNTLVVEDVLSYLPEDVIESFGGIEFAGKITLTDGAIKGTFNDSLMPVITAHVETEDAVVDIPDLPYPFTKIDLNTDFSLDLNDSVNAHNVVLTGMMNNTKLDIKGAVTDIIDDMAFDVVLKSDLPLVDISRGFLPKEMAIRGRADVDLKTKCSLDELLKTVTDFNFGTKLRANAKVNIKDFGFDMDTIHATAKNMGVDLVLPASAKVKGSKGAYVAVNSPVLNAVMGDDLTAVLNQFTIKTSIDHLDKSLEEMLADADIRIAHLDLDYDTITLDADHPVIAVKTSPKKGSGLNIDVNFGSEKLDAALGQAYTLNTQALSMKASARENKSKEDLVNHWNPAAEFTLTQADVNVAGIRETIHIPTIDFSFDPNALEFKEGTVKVGKSDMTLKGNVYNIDKWMEDHNNLMKGEMNITSNKLDFNEIMDLISGLGTESDTTEVVEEDGEDNPFMVPEGVDFSFGVHAKKALYDNFDLNELGGTMTIKDGTLLLQEIGFTNKAAEMQLTAMYQSPRKNHLFLGMDFHLLHVEIYDLLHMIPEIDTLVPMLKTFDGKAEFHIAAQTNLKSNYDLKLSTLRACADIEGANLRVKDIASFTKITDMLDVSTNGEYRIDSIDVQLTAFKDEVDLWPFQIAIGKYKAIVEGHYNLDQTGEYHISVVQSPLPTRLGLKIYGPLNDLKYSIESVRYPNLYRPERRSDTEQMVIELKKQIADKLKESVR